MWGRDRLVSAMFFEPIMSSVLDREFTDDEFQELIDKHRKKLKLWASVIEDNPELTQEAVAGQEYEAMAEPAEKKRQRAEQECDETRSKKVNKNTPAVLGDAGKGACSSSSGGASSSRDGDVAPAAPCSPRQKKIGPFNIKHWSQSEASALLPKTKGCSISPVAGRQWQVRYLQKVEAPRSRTITYDPDGREGLTNHVIALLRVVQWTWQAHTECTGEQCEWDLEGLLASASVG